MKIVALFQSAGELAEESPEHVLCAEHALELDELLGDEHELVVIDDPEEIDDHLDMDVCISSPFYPAYLTDERIGDAPNLDLSITAGVGSDHVDLDAALDADLTVAECTGSNVVSVAEHAVMQILILLRSFLSGHEQATSGGWDLAEAAAHARDIEGKTVGIFGLGKIGERVAARLQPFDVELLYNSSSRHEDTEEEYDMEFVELDELAERSDVVTIHAPLYDETKEIFDADLLSGMDEGSYIVNTARGKSSSEMHWSPPSNPTNSRATRGTSGIPNPHPRTIPGERCRTTR